MTKLTCQQCGGRAWIEGGFVQRECTHSAAGVTADMEAVAYGVSSTGVREDGRLAFLRRIVGGLVDKIRGRG